MNEETLRRHPPSVLTTQDHHPSMEKIHGEILDAFHRKSQDSREDESQQDCCYFSPNQEDSVVSETVLLSQTPMTVLLSDSTYISLRSHPMNSRARCSSMMQRRLNEAVQFYQAVGEKPPTSQSDLARLIENDDENDDSYFSDAESSVTEVCEEEEEDYGLCLSPDRTLLDASSWSIQDPFLHRLPGVVRTEDFQYKGLQANPPEVVYRGTSRGNYSSLLSLHRKAWLESADRKHRYGKNLQVYYRHWESIGCPTNIFFDWLDGKGEERQLPELEECPRSILDSDRVLYITDMNVTQRYTLSIVSDKRGRGCIFNADKERVRTGSDGWIFVLRDDVLYGTKKIAAIEGKEMHRFHHSSFFGGKAVAAAGILVTDDDGILKQVFPHSGHYRPGEAEVQRMLYFFFSGGVDLRTFDVDIQLLIKIDRHDCKKNKRKKTDSLYLRPATVVAHFLSHKARMIDKMVFEQIHKLQTLEGYSVREALRVID